MLVKKNQNQFIFWITASCLLLMLAVILFTPIFNAYASNGSSLETQTVKSVDIVGQTAGLQKSDPRQIAGKIIKIFLGVLGVFALCIVLWAGYVYMTSGGDPTKVQNAKAWMTNGLIGLIIIFSAYSIVAFLFNALKGDPNGNFNISSTIPKGLGYSLSGNAFGEIMSGHSPYPEQSEVPRNTMIVVTFKLPVDPTSFIDLTTVDAYVDCPAALTKCTASGCPDNKSVCGPVNKTTFKTYRCDKMVDWPAGTAASDCLNATVKDPALDTDVVSGFVLITEDRKTVVFNPFGAPVTADKLLGSADENVSYIVHLEGGATGVKKQEPAGTAIFTDVDGYKWRFTTGTFVDLTPPKVSMVIPTDQAGITPYTVIDGSLDGATPRKVFRNQIVVANFNEPVLPLFATDQTGCVAGNSSNEAQLVIDANEKVGSCATSHVPGNWLTGINQYKTIQFLSILECEGVTENSCGEKVFCLPANKNLNGLLQAADIDAEMALIGTGIVDLAGNSLDGNGNGTANGGSSDDFDWTFGVGNSIDLTPPSIVELSPKNVSQNVDPSVAIRAIFDEGLEPATVDTEVFLYGQLNYSGWFDPNIEISTAVPAPNPAMNIINISHGPFYKVPEAGTGESQAAGPIYMPVIKAQVRDMRQNCFTPSRNLSVTNTSLISNTASIDCTDDVSDDISNESFGISCCPLGTDYKPTRVIPGDAASLNECEMTGIIR